MWALSIRQPWAWLIVNGYKDIENRSWYSNFQGRFLVHASQRMDEMSLPEIVRHYGLDIPEPEQIHLDRGGIVGEAAMIGCVKNHSSKWFHGEFGFVLKDARPLPFVPCRGRLGFFKIDHELLPDRPDPRQGSLF